MWLWRKVGIAVMAQNRGPEPKLGKEDIHRWQELGMGHQSPKQGEEGFTWEGYLVQGAGAPAR